MSLLKKLSDYHEKPKGVQGFLYSENGAGKTFWMAGAGDDWIFMTDGNGVLTLESKLFKDKVGTNPFVVKLVPDESPTQPKMFDAIRNQIDGFLAPSTKDDFRGIIFDDINSIRGAALNKAVDLNGMSGKSKTAVNMQSGKFKDIVIPTMADFGTSMSLTESFLRQTTEGLREEGKHSLIGAHQRLYRAKGDNTVIAIKPLLTGTDTPDIIPGIFDFCWYLRVVGSGSNTKRELVTEAEAGIMAKTRLGGLFKPIERDLTAKQAFDRIEKWLKEGIV